jgi:hypothetical protein
MLPRSAERQFQEGINSVDTLSCPVTICKYLRVVPAVGSRYQLYLKGVGVADEKKFQI